jgi:hypothetical protein
MCRVSPERFRQYIPGAIAIIGNICLVGAFRTCLMPFWVMDLQIGLAIHALFKLKPK